MAWQKAFFICSAITAYVQGLPGITRYLEKDFYLESQRENKGQFFQHVQHPAVKDKISMHEYLTEEFIHQSQTLKEKKGTDQEIYMNNSNFITIDKKKKTGTIIQLVSKDDFTEIVNTSGSNIPAATKIPFMETFRKEDELLLNKKEASITRSRPKYFDAISVPSSAFSGELSERKETSFLIKDKIKISRVSVTQKTSRPIQIAGPMPYPQSTYAREFDLPFYD